MANILSEGAKNFIETLIGHKQYEGQEDLSDIQITPQGTASSTEKKDEPQKPQIEDDLDISSKSDPSKYKDKLIEYMKDMGAIAGGAQLLIDSNKDARIDCIIRAAVSIWQTRKGTTIAATQQHNPGCIPGSTENKNLADLKAGYEAMEKQLESHLTDTDGKYLSSLRLQYVKKAVTVQDAIGLEEDDQKNKNAKDYADLKDDAGKPVDAKAKLNDQQLWWHEQLKDVINDLYDKLLGAKPKWEKRDVNKKNAAGNKTSPSDGGVKTKSRKPHGDHTDEILVKLPQNKTYAEPVYPDLITVADSVPQWIKTLSTVKGSDVLSGMYDQLTQDDITSGKTTTKTTSNGTTVTVESGGQQAAASTTGQKADIIPGTIVHEKDQAEQEAAKQAKKIDENKNQNSNATGDTQQPTEADNTVNKDTPSEPYVAGKPLASSPGNSTLKTINDLTNNQLADVLGAQNDRLAKQIVYDPSKHRNSFKQPARGKPANNNDAFPVDLKIEELELHYPHAYIHELQCCPQGVSVGKALLQHASNVEKRIVKLENNMATLMRNTFAMGGRIFVNCVYWGGTTA